MPKASSDNSSPDKWTRLPRCDGLGADPKTHVREIAFLVTLLTLFSECWTFFTLCHIMHTPTKIPRFHSGVSASSESTTPLFPSFRLFRKGIYIARICIPNAGTSNNFHMLNNYLVRRKISSVFYSDKFFCEAVSLVPLNPEFRKQSCPVKFDLP